MLFNYYLKEMQDFVSLFLSLNKMDKTIGE